MRMTLAEAFDMIARGETPEQYEKRIRRIRRLANERDYLEDVLTIFDPVEDAEKYAKKKKRLEKVLAEIDRLV